MGRPGLWARSEADPSERSKGSEIDRAPGLVVGITTERRRAKPMTGKNDEAAANDALTAVTFQRRPRKPARCSARPATASVRSREQAAYPTALISTTGLHRPGKRQCRRDVSVDAGTSEGDPGGLRRPMSRWRPGSFPLSHFARESGRCRDSARRNGHSPPGRSVERPPAWADTTGHERDEDTIGHRPI